MRSLKLLYHVLPFLCIKWIQTACNRYFVVNSLGRAGYNNLNLIFNKAVEIYWLYLSLKLQLCIMDDSSSKKHENCGNKPRPSYQRVK